MKDVTKRFKSYDGLELEGLLLLPKANAKAAVLLVHGITSERDESGFYSRMAQAFAAAGIASFRFDYRSHGSNKLPSTEMSLSGIVNDIGAAMQTLRTEVDAATPIFPVGTSFGGGLTAYWAGNNPGQARGLFLCAPVIDYEDDIERNTADWRGSLRKGKSPAYAGGMPIGRPLLTELPHINGKAALEQPGSPIHIFHGTEDTDVPLSSSQRYENASRKVFLHKIPGVGHGFGAPGDEDFETKETKANHDAIYAQLIDLISSQI